MLNDAFPAILQIYLCSPRLFSSRKKTSFGARSKLVSHTAGENVISYGRRKEERRSRMGIECESTEIYCACLPIFTVIVMRPAFIYLGRDYSFGFATRRKNFHEKNMDLYIAGFVRCNITTDARSRRRRRISGASALNVRGRYVENDSGAIKPRLKIM